MYRIFSIKRQGRLFKTRPRRPGVFSGPRRLLSRGIFIIFDSVYFFGLYYFELTKFTAKYRKKQEKLEKMPSISSLVTSKVQFQINSGISDKRRGRLFQIDCVDAASIRGPAFKQENTVF